MYKAFTHHPLSAKRFLWFGRGGYSGSDNERIACPLSLQLRDSAGLCVDHAHRSSPIKPLALSFEAPLPQ